MVGIFPRPWRWTENTNYLYSLIVRHANQKTCGPVHARRRLTQAAGQAVRTFGVWLARHSSTQMSAAEMTDLSSLTPVARVDHLAQLR